MADTKVSALTAVTTPAVTDEFGVNQGGTSKKITLGQVASFARPTRLVVAASNAPTSVKNGADYVCNGSNDAAQIMAAIAALPAAGGTIELSAGLFTLTGQGTMTDDALSQPYCILIDQGDGAVQIVGQGIDATRLELASSQASNTIPLLVRGTDAARRTAPTLLFGFTLDGNAATQTAWTDFGILEIVYAEQVTVDTVKLVDSPYFLMQSFRKASDIRFARCTFVNANANNEFRFEHPNFIVTQCRFEAPVGATNGSSLSLTVNDDIGDWAARDGRIFSNLFIGGFVPIALVGARGCIIADNEIMLGATSDNGSEGIRLSHWTALLNMDSDRNIIIGNRIVGAGTGIRLESTTTYGSKNNIVAHNIVENANNHFWGVRESGASSDFNLILDNLLTESFFNGDIVFVGANTVVRRPNEPISRTIVDAKGDLIVATAADTVARLAVGANDTVPMADSGQATGIKWVASQTPSTQAFGDTAAEGTADTYARGDHKHGMPAGAWDQIVTLAAQASTSNTTATDMTGMASSSLAINSTYEFEAVLIMNKASQTNGLKIAINGPSGSSVSATIIGVSAAATLATGAITALASLSTPTFATVANVDSVVVVKGFFKTGGTAGALQMQHASVTSQASRAQIGSTLKLRKVA